MTLGSPDWITSCCYNVQTWNFPFDWYQCYHNCLYCHWCYWIETIVNFNSKIGNTNKYDNIEITGLDQILLLHCLALDVCIPISKIKKHQCHACPNHLYRQSSTSPSHHSTMHRSTIVPVLLCSCPHCTVSGEMVKTKQNKPIMRCEITQTTIRLYQMTCYSTVTFIVCLNAHGGYLTPVKEWKSDMNDVFGCCYRWLVVTQCGSHPAPTNHIEA